MQTFIGLSLFSLGLVAGMGAVSHSQESERSNIRLEAGFGKCRYGMGQDGQWRKDNYATKLELISRCMSLGASQAPWHTPAGMLGWRVNYVDFGTAKADTFVPARDEDANNFPSGQNCNQTTFKDCVGHYEQEGRARGITLGTLLENKTQYGTFGTELGLFRYTSYWKVQATVPGPGTCSGCGTPASWEWDHARGTHYTWYAGFTYSYDILFIQYRRYHATYASQASVTNEPLNIGLIAGPLDSLTVGLKWELK